MLVALHASDSGYQDYLNTWEGTEGEYVAFRPADLRRGGRRRSIDPGRAGLGDLPRDAHPLPRRQAHQRRERRQLGRARSLSNLEHAYKKMPNEFPEHPLEVFHRNVWVNPFWEDSVTGLIDLDRRRPGLLRLRLPAPRGPRRPARVAPTSSTDLPSTDVERIMSTNLKGLLAA